MKRALHGDVAWCYREPVVECPRIIGVIASFNARVDLVVDGVRRDHPQDAWSS